MFKMNNCSYACLVIVCLAASQCPADMAGVEVDSGVTVWRLFSGADTVVGWRFTTNTDITVTSLGLFDWGSDGFAGTYDLGLFASNGTTLATASIGPGTSASIVGGFQYADISPLSLMGGQTYAVAFYSSASDAPKCLAPTLSEFEANSAINWIGTYVEYSTGSLQYPTRLFTDSDDVYPGTFGANFRFMEANVVPLPGAVFLGFLGLGAAGMKLRQFV